MATLYFDGDPAVGSNTWDDPLSWWTDAGATIPAATTPANGDSVYVYGATAIVAGPSAAVSLFLLDTSNYTGTSGMDATIFNANITIGSGGSLNFAGTGPGALISYGGGTDDASPSMVFGNYSKNVSIWSASSTNFNGNSENDGNITGPVFYNGTSTCQSTAVTGNVTITSTAFTGTIAITGNLLISSGANVSSSGFTVTGTTIITGSATTVDGGCVFNGDIAVNLGANVGICSGIGNITLNNASTINPAAGGTLSMSGDLTINNTSSITGTTSFSIACVNLALNNSATITNSNLTINASGDGDFHGSSVISGGAINVVNGDFYDTASITGGTLTSSILVSAYVSFYNSSSNAGGSVGPYVNFYNSSIMSSGSIFVSPSGQTTFFDISSFTGGAIATTFLWQSSGLCNGVASTVGGVIVNVVVPDAPVVATIPSGGLAISTTSVTSYAAGIQSGATVTVGGVSATSVTVVDSNKITYTTPTGTVGPKTIVITNPDTSTITQTNGYTYYSTGGGAGINRRSIQGN